MVKWRRREPRLRETDYALRLAVMAAEAEVDEETADRLLYAASSAVLRAKRPEDVLPILAALRPLGEKAPHRYVRLLTYASAMAALDQETAQYVYDALRQFKSRLLETGRNWSLVEAIIAYANLLKNYAIPADSWEDAVADMCQLYAAIAAPSRGSLAQRLLGAIAKAHVITVALSSNALEPLVQRHCGLGDLVREAEAVRDALDIQPGELRKIEKDDADFAELVAAWGAGAEKSLKALRAMLTAELARYKLFRAGKPEDAAKEFEKAAEMYRGLEWGSYIAARSWAVKARVLAAGSWDELLERAEGFQKLCREAEPPEPAAVYLAPAAYALGDCLVYLAASGDKKKAEKLLKERRQLLEYVPWVSVTARLMLRFFGVGEGASREEVVGASVPDADQELVERLKSEIESKVPEARPLLDRADGKTLAEVLAPGDFRAQLALMLLAAVEGRADAVRLHGLWGSVAYGEPLLRQLFRAVYENCGDLNSEGCKMALLKLYYF
jgi:tetratricopeptide (TPR) repeat protein